MRNCKDDGFSEGKFLLNAAAYKPPTLPTPLDLLTAGRCYFS